MLLAKRPDRPRRKENRGADAMQSSLENSFPAWSRRFRRLPDRYVNKRISGRCFTLIELEVGHAAMGCTSHAKPGMEIALATVTLCHYTDPK